MPLVEIIDFNALIDNKPVFDQPVRNKKRIKNYWNVIEMSKYVDYTKGNLLGFSCHQKYY